MSVDTGHSCASEKLYDEAQGKDKVDLLDLRQRALSPCHLLQGVWPFITPVAILSSGRNFTQCVSHNTATKRYPLLLTVGSEVFEQILDFLPFCAVHRRCVFHRRESSAENGSIKSVNKPF